MSQALVLGATGHIGLHVVRAFLGRGYAVRAASRGPERSPLLAGLPVETVQLDVTDTAALRAALEGCDVVVHCAGYYPRFTDRRDPAVARGIEQTRHVCDVFQHSGIPRIVYLSSAATIVPVPGRVSTEADRESWPLSHRCTLYAAVKIAMEHTVREYVQRGLPVVIINPSVCIGEYDARPFSGQLVLVFAKRQLPVYLDHQLNAVYTGDVGHACVLAAERGHIGGSYLIAAENLTLGEFAGRVAREAGVSPPRWRVPYALALLAATMTEIAAAMTRTEPLLSRQVVRSARSPQRLDGSKAVRELHLRYTPVDEAIRRALAWFTQHRYL